jgi:hypothetical protein
MKMRAYILAFLILFGLPTIVFGGVFKVYPGAKFDEEATYEARQPGGGSKTSNTPTIFMTNDFFENVVAFYRGTAREYRMPGWSGKSRLSSGQKLEEAYFILDDAADIMTSKHWIKIQRPYVGKGQTKAFHEKYEAFRDVTAIIVEDNRSYPQKY